MARRIVNRMEKRAEYEAYERRQDDDEVEGEEEEKEKDDDEEEESEEEAEGDDEAAGGGDDDDEAPVKKPKKKPAKPAKVAKVAKPKTRTRAPKAVPRMKVVWGVFDNSSRRVAVYDYPKKKEADDHAARLRSEKNQTYFVQPVKEPMDEKKE